MFYAKLVTFKMHGTEQCNNSKNSFNLHIIIPDHITHSQYYFSDWKKKRWDAVAKNVHTREARYENILTDTITDN